MPGGISSLDIGFPSFTGGESTEQKVGVIQNYLFMLLETLKYLLNHLDEENFNPAALESLKAEIAKQVKTETVITDVVISNTVITQNLYAEYGDIAELAVDYLMTLNKVARWWAADTTDANFIRVHDQTYETITAQTDGSTVQLTDRYGRSLYYKAAVTASTYKTVGMGTDKTAWPVTVYKYTELVKMVTGHVYDSVSGNRLPMIVMGAGTGDRDNGKAVIIKDSSGLRIKYKTEVTGKDILIEIDNGGDVKKTVSGRSGTVQAALIFTNITITAGAWTADTTYTDFPYKADISCPGVDSDMTGDVIFHPAAVRTYDFAPAAATGDGIVSVYAAAAPTSDVIVLQIRAVF